MKFFSNNTNKGTIRINGKTYVGNNISMVGNKVYIDGKLQGNGDFSEEKEIKIEVLCDIDRIESEESVNVYGNVHGNVFAKGSVNCDNVTGNVEAKGSVNCDNVGGNVKANGSVNCDVIKGRVL